MNKQVLLILIISVIAVMTQGCSDRLDMEDATFPLAIGMDLDKDNKFRFYTINPEFSKETPRESRSVSDAHSSGVFQGKNYQVLLVGKRILLHDDWFRLLDVIFRDSKNTVTDRVIYYDGPLSQIIYINPPDQPLLPLFLRGMVDTKYARSETVKTTIQELHRQIFDKGMTPYISEIKLDTNKDIVLKGTALLDHKGKYAASLDTQETIILNILQKNTTKTISLTIPVHGLPKTGPFNTDKLIFNTGDVKTKIHTSYRKKKFKFDINVSMVVGLTEVLFPIDPLTQVEKFNKVIAQQIKKQCENLIKKIQLHKVDPIGLGIYARAYEYKYYKEVEDNWGEALAQADIEFNVKVTIASMGAVK